MSTAITLADFILFFVLFTNITKDTFYFETQIAFLEMSNFAQIYVIHLDGRKGGNNTHDLAYL